MDISNTNTVTNETPNKYIAWISLDNRRLACGELEIFLGAKLSDASSNARDAFTDHAHANDHIIFFSYNGDESKFSRLAFTHRIARICETFPLDKVPNQLAQQINTPSYRVEFFNSSLEIDQETANKVYRIAFSSIADPHVSLKNPATVFCCFIDFANIQKTVYIAQQVWQNDFAYEQRKSHLRAHSHAAVMPPKLVRVMINLTGISGNATATESILDPFCGTGGVLIEAMHCGIHAVGSDISAQMIAGAKENCKNEIAARPQFREYCDPTSYIIKECATKIAIHADAIVTDVPYGKNTKKLENKNLYYDFLVHVAKNKLTKRIVICMPHYAHGAKIIEKTPWRTLASFSLRVHNSLTRELFVLTLN